MNRMVNELEWTDGVGKCGDVREGGGRGDGQVSMHEIIKIS